MGEQINIDDLEEFLMPVSDELPCGEDLGAKGVEEYLRIEREVETATEVKEWANLRKSIVPLLVKTKDFRLLSFYGATLVNTEKKPFSGLVETLLIAKRYIQDDWECVFPQEDEEDEEDRFTDRLNAIGELGAWATVVLPLTKKRALVSFKGMNEYSLGELLKLRRGEEVEGKQPPKQFIKALPEAELAEIDSILKTVILAQDISGEIKKLVTDKTEESFIEFDKYLFPMLQDVVLVLSDFSPAGKKALQSEEKAEKSDDPTKITALSSGSNNAEGVFVVKSRNDVVTALDKICEYYNHHEPSSPLPLLLRRARDIVHKDFLEVLEELVPESISMTESVFGRKEEVDDN